MGFLCSVIYRFENKHEDEDELFINKITKKFLCTPSYTSSSAS